MTTRLLSMLCITFVLYKAAFATTTMEYCRISCQDEGGHDGAETEPRRIAGTPGQPGPIGPKGNQGRDGRQGPVGPIGPAGVPGKSCECSTQAEEIRSMKKAITQLQGKVTGWRLLSNGLWYKLYENNATYQGAKTDCEGHRATLATRGLRNATIRRELANTWEFNVRVWVGIDDIVQEGRFVWIDNVVSTPSNTDWNAGEPNGRRIENCGHVYLISGVLKLNDYLCSRSTPYLCEADAPSFE